MLGIQRVSVDTLASDRRNMAETSARICDGPRGLHGALMVERRRRRPRKVDGTRREAPRFERVRVDAPPGLSTVELAFPWTSSIAIDSDPVPRVSRTRHAAPAPRRRNPVAE